ncbi:hypothetical protein ACP4OV_004487 [Aristida adscensionis]
MYTSRAIQHASSRSCTSAPFLLCRRLPWAMRELMSGREALVWLFLFVLVVTFIVVGVVQLALVVTSGDPQYTVAVAGVAGLEDLAPAAEGDKPPRAALSPVFNLTVRVDNSQGKTSEACVRVHAAAVVSYGDAFLGRGFGPAFCAGALRAGQGVAVPRFLRERLAGELRRGEARRRSTSR